MDYLIDVIYRLVNYNKKINNTEFNITYEDVKNVFNNRVVLDSDLKYIFIKNHIDAFFYLVHNKPTLNIKTIEKLHKILNENFIDNNLNVYSKDEQDKLVNNKVDKNGANLRNDETNKQNWRDKLDTYSKEEFNSLLNPIKTKTGELDKFSNELRTNKKVINAGIASALANASLPQPVDREDHGLLIGIGTYGGEYGFSLGYSKIFKKHIITKFSTSIDSEKNTNFGASIGWHLNQ